MRCGIDFGTSNSAVVGLVNGVAVPCQIEGTHETIPTAVFYDFEDRKTYFGRQAIARYVEGYEGRLMRSLKSVLGSSLLNESTIIGGKRVAFRDVIRDFFFHIKDRGEVFFGQSLDQATLGRPVFFVDDDPEADQAAENTLREIAGEAGFSGVTFEYEPSAALRDWVDPAHAGKVVLVMDIGGGTADFALARCRAEQGLEFINVGGVHVGGTDFDRFISLDHLMPILGKGSAMTDAFGGKRLTVPNGYFSDLATWHRINALYSAKVITELEQIQRLSLEPAKIDQLVSVVRERDGHALLFEIERIKIALSSQASVDQAFAEFPALSVDPLSQEALEEALSAPTDRIMRGASKTLSDAGMVAGDLDFIVMTGGSSQMPVLAKRALEAFPQATLTTSDFFSSVANGLALAAQDAF